MARRDTFVRADGKPIRTRPTPEPGPRPPRPPRPKLVAPVWLSQVRQRAPLQILCGGLCAAALVVLALAFAEWRRPAETSGAAPTSDAVIARVTLAPGDGRSLAEVCRQADVPQPLCDLSAACANRRGEATAAHQLTLYLRAPPDGACAG